VRRASQFNRDHASADATPVRFPWTRFIGGGVQVPSSIAGFSQYTRMVTLKSSAAAGNPI